jgi:hypothetical protein
VRGGCDESERACTRGCCDERTLYSKNTSEVATSAAEMAMVTFQARGMPWRAVRATAATTMKTKPQTTTARQHANTKPGIGTTKTTQR